MPDWIVIALAVVAAYLWGGISPSRIINNRFRPDDPLGDTRITLPNSPNANIRYRGISATAVGAELGPKWGAIAGLLDALKVLVPFGLAYFLVPSIPTLPFWIAIAAIVGHNWPVQNKFKGGRGQTLVLAVLLVLDPIGVLVCLTIGVLVGLFILRDMFVAADGGQYLLIVWFVLFGTPAEAVFALVGNLIYLFASWPEGKEYFAARARGEVGKIESFRDFFTAHPAMGAKRFDTDEADES